MVSPSKSSTHDRINLGRILARLEAVVVKDPQRGAGGAGGRVGLEGKSWWEVRRLSEVRLMLSWDEILWEKC